MTVKMRFMCFLLVFGLASAKAAYCNDDRLIGMDPLAEGIAKTLATQGTVSIVLTDFQDTEGRTGAFGRTLSEDLTIRLFMTQKVQIVDTAIARHLLGVRELTLDSILDEDNARKLSSHHIDCVLVGTLIRWGNVTRLTVKIYTTRSPHLVGAGSIDFPDSPTVSGSLSAHSDTIAPNGTEPKEKSGRGVSAQTEGAVPARGFEASVGQSDLEEKPLGTKDLGLLRVIFKSIAQPPPGDEQGGLHATLELINRDTSNSMVVALNGDNASLAGPSSNRIRTRIIDYQGGVWKLLPPGLYGVGVVRAGVHGRGGSESYSPAEIGRLLQLRDQLGRDVDDPADGFYANASSCGEGGCNTTFDSRIGNNSPRQFFPFRGNSFINGSTVPIGPGKSITVSMAFVAPNQSRDFKPTLAFQLQSEIVVGTVESFGRRNYQLHNVTFEVESMPAN
jgi:hypothetical protein